MITLCQCINSRDYQSHTSCTLQQQSHGLQVTHVTANRNSDTDKDVQAPTETHSSGNHLSDRTHQRPETTSVLSTNKRSDPTVSPVPNWDVASLQFKGEVSMGINVNHDIQKLQDGDSDLTHTDSCRCEQASIKYYRSFTPREVFQHNCRVGWNQWSIYKYSVYDNGMLKEILCHLLINARKTRADKQDDRRDLKISSTYLGKNDEFSTEAVKVWKTNRIQALLTSKLEEAIVETCAALCRIGTLVQHTDAEYYEDFKQDVECLLNDLIGEECNGTLTLNKREYMHVLQRWLKKHTNLHVQHSQHPVSIVGETSFPLPENIQANPGCLRPWLRDWEPFDSCIPDSGAWLTIETQQTDLGNTHEIYLSSLRSHVDLLSPFETSVDGEAAWHVISEGLIANDVMTETQKLTERERLKRVHFLDPEAMERRRRTIMYYFIDKYKYSIEAVQHFLHWADAMEVSETKFLQLCDCM